MSSRTIREIYSTSSGASTGLPFAACCWAWFLKELLGFTNFSESGIGGTFITSSANGSNGELNLTGSDKNFRDAVASPFGAGDVGKYLVIKDSVDRNCGIFKITAFVSATTVTIDFRSGTTEFPTVSTGIVWYLISDVASQASGSLSFTNGDTFSYGTRALLNDGQGCNFDRAMVWYPMYHYVGGWPPGDTRNWVSYAWTGNSWHGGVIAGNPFVRWSDLVGKTINITAGSSSQSVTFTGTDPLSITQVITQINAAFSGSHSSVCYESDYIGYPRSGGGYITFRAAVSGLPGEPAYPASHYQYSGGPEEGGPANNNITLTYSGSTAWTYLGLTGTGNLSSAAISTSVRGVDNRTDIGPTPSTTIAGWATSDINGWGGDLFSAATAGSTTNITNTIAGAHGNRSTSVVGSGVTPSGMSGGSIPTTEGDYFRCKTPHALGWEVEVAIFTPRTIPFIRVMVSTNGAWDETGKIIGPVYFGSVASAANWCYAEGDTDGKWINFFVHQATNNRHNGCLVANVEVFDTGHGDAEKVALMGNVGNTSTDFDNGNLVRNYDTKRVGHGYVMDDRGVPTQHNVYMLEPTYSGWANGLSKWTSRERNRRRSGSQSGSFTGDSIAMSGSTATLTKSTATFVANDVGKKIQISGCTNAGNNGTFVITARLSATQIQFTNASGVNETSSFAWTMDLQDIMEGTLIVADENNYNGRYEVYGRLWGHYSVRGGTVGGWANRKGFSEDGFLDKIHINDGIAINWPNVTPQH